jgi:acetyltransferase-like isoleucine patch superfamily enzyme
MSKYSFGNATLLVSSLILRLKLKRHKVFFGSNLIGSHNTYIENKGKIEIGKQSCLFSNRSGHTAKTALITDNKNACIKIGNHFTSQGARIYAADKIIIGEHVMLAAGVSISDSEGHPVCINVENRYHGKPQVKPVIIGNNVWLAQNATVLNGISIGNNSIIGANSVVTHDVEENCVYAGVPAKLIKKLE